MSIIRISLALAAGLLLWTGNASADPARPLPASIRPAADSLRDAGLAVRDQEPRVDARGNEEAFLFLNDRFEAARDRLIRAFEQDEVLPGGFRVMARATRKATGEMFFTLQRPQGDWLVVELLRDGQQAIARIDADIVPKNRTAAQALPTAD